MRQHFRPYTMVVQTASTGTEEVVILRDTSGTPLECNYVSVSVSGDGDARTSQFRIAVAPAGLGTPKANWQSAEDSIGVETSGVPASTFTASTPTELLLSDKDRVSTIYLQAYDPGGNANYFITYGQVSVGNNLRDQERPIGS